jgi:hypothetical protein
LPRRSPRLATLACDEVGAPTTEAAAAAVAEEEEEECMPAGYIARTKAGAHKSFMERKLQQLNAVAEAPLGSDLLVHRSKLEQAKADADAKARAGLAEARKAPTSTIAAVAGSLGADLRIHKSKLELAKEAAIAAKAAGASTTPGRGAKRGRDEGDGTSSLTDMKIHKSGLERAKEAASGLPTTPAGARKAATQSRAAQKLAAEWGAWDGQPMDGLLKRHESKLEKDAKAWKAMAAKQKGEQ